MSIRKALAQLANDFDAGRGIGKIVETEFEKSVSVFVFPFSGTSQLGRARKPQRYANMRERSWERRHEARAG